MKISCNSLTGMTVAVISANLFSSKVLFVKLAYAESATPLQILCLRMATALPFFAMVLFYLLWKYPDKRPTKQDIAGMTVLGLIGYYLSSLLDFHGMVYLSSGMERLLLYLYPSFLVLIRSLHTGSLPGKPELLSLLLAYSGAALVYRDEHQALGTDVLRGSILVVGAAFCFALYLYFSGTYIRRYGPRLFASFSTSVSCAAILLHGLVTDAGGATTLTPLILSIGILTGILCTVIPTFAMHQAIGMIGSSKVGILGTSGIICPLVLGVALFGEPLTISRVLGAFLVMLSVISLGRRAKSA